MKFSIVTPSYNQARFIEQNIRSVQQQDFAPVEHIVVDGGSKDGTVEILESFPHLRWVSEKDRGQTDALNKGIRMSTGDIIGWINSDDYYEPSILGAVAREFEDPACNWVVGDITAVYEGTDRIVKAPSAEITFESLCRDPDILRQQGTFFRKSFLERAGEFDESLHLVMDLDMWLRLSRLDPPRMLHRNLAYFRLHQDQKTSGLHSIKQFREMKLVFSRHPGGTRNLGRIRIRKYLTWLRVAVRRALRG